MFFITSRKLSPLPVSNKRPGSGKNEKPEHTMNAVELIKKKRNRGMLTRAEQEFLIGGYLAGSIPEYQMSAFLMAVYFAGMTSDETALFTQVMLHSGATIDLSRIPGKKVDKHSTGGVGDKVSLILAPMVAACGVPVPMVSGRGLGHTGGTLDKLESIPGFRTDFSVEEFRLIIEETGLAFAGQTDELAPADRKMYALRDVTATIESLPLIAASIMSKKLAEGIDALVLDVKTGKGAFMRSYEDAVLLAQLLVSIGTAEGKETIAFVTAMDTPLGLSVGNWLEVVEAVECLRGKKVRDLMEVTSVLGGAMVWLGGKAMSLVEGIRLCRSALWSGNAYEKFLQIVQRQGGETSVITDPGSYVRARHVVEVRCPGEGVVTAIDALRVGMLAMELGAGRVRMDERIDPGAGIRFVKRVGDRVARNDVLAEIHTERGRVVDHGVRELASCVSVGESAPPVTPLVKAIVDRDGVKSWANPEVY
jgi:pyrimidine-nucleoside phosphorylase